MEDFPEDWKKSHITMIPKEGDITNCYRGISILSAPGRAKNNTLKNAAFLCDFFSSLQAQGSLPFTIF